MFLARSFFPQWYEFQQFWTRDAAQPELQYFFDQRRYVGVLAAREHPDNFLDSSQDRVRHRSRIRIAHQVHLDSKIERPFNQRCDPVVEILDLIVEFVIEARRMVE